MSKTTVASKQHPGLPENDDRILAGTAECNKIVDEGQTAASERSESMSSSVMQVSTATDLRPSQPSTSRSSLARIEAHALSPGDKTPKHIPNSQLPSLNSAPAAPRNKMSVQNLISAVDSDIPRPPTALRCSFQNDENVPRSHLRSSILGEQRIPSSFAGFEPKMGSTARQAPQGFVAQPDRALGSLCGFQESLDQRRSSLTMFPSAFAIARGVKRVPDVQTPHTGRPPYSSYISHKARAADLESNAARREYVERQVSSHTSQFQPLVNEPKAKRPWTEQEDTLLRSLVEQLGHGLWAAIAAQIPGRSGKQVRERWLNHLSPNVTKRPWSADEDDIIIESHKRFGNCWSRIAKLLDGRSDNSVKNRFYTTLRRRISVPRSVPRSTGKRGSPAYSQAALQPKKKKASPSVQQPSEQVEIVNRGFNQGKVWE